MEPLEESVDHFLGGITEICVYFDVSSLSNPLCQWEACCSWRGEDWIRESIT